MMKKVSIKNGMVLLTVFLSLVLFSFLTIYIQRDREGIKGVNDLQFEVEPSIVIEPDLNISRFAPYIISSTGIPESPESVFLNISGKNGDGGDCWDYYADGTCSSEPISKQMTYSNGEWVSPNIYPDYIYPEIYFAPSNITWNNVPLSLNVRRNNYHIMHL